MALQGSLILLLVSFLCMTLASHYLLLSINAKKDTLRQGQHLYVDEQLTSAGGVFIFGFFTLVGYSSESCYFCYLGIWYASRPEKPVWVANRENPVTGDSLGVVTMETDGILRLSYSGGNRFNVSNSNIQLASSNNNNTVTAAATLLDSGNLIVRQVYTSNGSSNSSSSFGRVLWQSFDYPTNILLPGMKLGMNLRTNQSWFLTSWISDEVPAQGAFKLGVDGGSGSSSLQLVMWRRDHVYWTSGPLINGSFSNASQLTDFKYINYKFVANEDEKNFSFDYKSNSTPPTLELGLNGQIVITNSDGFSITYQIPLTPCDQNKDVVCLKEDTSKCRNGSEQYFEAWGITPGNYSLWESDNMRLGLSDCHALCWNNCSCHAYTSMFPNGTGCRFWENISYSYTEVGSSAYLRSGTVVEGLLAFPPTASPIGEPTGEPMEEPKEMPHPHQFPRCYLSYCRSFFPPGSTEVWGRWWIWCLVAIIPTLAKLLFIFLCHLRKRNPNWKQQTEERERSHGKSLITLRSQTIRSYEYDVADRFKFNTRKGQHLPLYTFHQIVTATDNFSSVNKLGQGGFGPVYKGVLPTGQHVAVKRLSRSSGQGLEEFKNEITLIAELQHMNLVKLLGGCIQGEEKVLIYEYMPNKSLDSFLFDPTKRQLLGWKRRLNIIEGIAQGLLYLHKYSRMRVIHRDLKASNILLDDKMNPKISDFGLARIFGQDESEANTNRVVGTYGYMSPEYAMNEIFSVKSDVYSFRVLLLEIVSGKKNTSFSRLSGPLSLIEHAWDLWKKGSSLELIDPSLDFSCSKTQQLRCIHVGLLCVQECANDRPTMSDVIVMVTNETMCLPDPKQPAFFTGSSRNRPTLPAENKSENCSINPVSTSVMEPR